MEMGSPDTTSDGKVATSEEYDHSLINYSSHCVTVSHRGCGFECGCVQPRTINDTKEEFPLSNSISINDILSNGPCIDSNVMVMENTPHES
jgi:hypothetical protein